MLPPGVVYEREPVEKCVTKHPNKDIAITSIDGRTITRSLHFHHFPFMYGPNPNRTKPRVWETMSTDHYIAYVSPLTGKIPETRATKIHAPRATSTSASPAPVGDARTAETADEILKIFGENEARKGSATAELESVKRELAEVKTRLEEEMDSAARKIAGIVTSAENQKRNSMQGFNNFMVESYHVREKLEEELAKSRGELEKRKFVLMP